ncbi:MAG TPA: hypothetical protein VGB70_12335 [Allosphingosinicella sp.]|jgi:hypothetical protein
MEITKLPLGVVAPSDTDCVRIEQEPDGTFKMTASALCAGGDDQESVSIVDGPPYGSVEQAEEAGLAWADDVGAEHLYISVGTLERPLQPTEIDLPL